MDDLQLFTVDQVAQRLRYKPRWVLDRIREGKLKAIVDGRLIRVVPEDLEAFIRSSRRWR